jgi:hypothetical protein
MATGDKELTMIEPWAAGVGIAMLVIVSGVAGFTAWDRAHVSSIEGVITPTAVGDTHFVKMPPGGKGATGIKYHGQLLDSASDDKLRDARMLRVDADDSGTYSIYKLEDDPSAQLYLKAAADDFIEVKPE